MPTKINLPKTLTTESEQAVAFLERISEVLKQQRRHFDDAVVTHCLRLIQDYVQDHLHQDDPEWSSHKDGGRKP